MVNEREKDPKVKSIKLPHGVVRFKKQQPEFVRDEPKLIEWAKESQRLDLIKLQESFNWSELKKNIAVAGGVVFDTDTGEAIEHVKVVEREDKFEVVVD